MRTVYDVQQLLRAYGIIVYTGDRKDDLLLMEMEVLDLYHSKFIDGETMKKAVMILRMGS
ncbi:YqgQ family protein [Chungangia koreensis]|uniref:YqgQ family protein n=1 Tax=Chungangia koreensis TaxID=752657 RepID=A0ABV8X758_9LACT